MKGWYDQFNPSEPSESVVRARFRTPKLKTPKIKSPEDDIEKAVVRVMDYIDRAVVASKRDFQRSLHSSMSPKTLSRILYVMTEIGYLEIVRTEAGSTGFYRVSPRGATSQKRGPNGPNG